LHVIIKCLILESGCIMCLGEQYWIKSHLGPNW